jgi:hypothetical protein
MQHKQIISDCIFDDLHIVPYILLLSYCSPIINLFRVIFLQLNMVTATLIEVHKWARVLVQDIVGYSVHHLVFVIWMTTFIESYLVHAIIIHAINIFVDYVWVTWPPLALTSRKVVMTLNKHEGGRTTICDID